MNIFIHHALYRKRNQEKYGEILKYMKDIRFKNFTDCFSEGLCLNGCEVNVLSILPITRKNCKRLFFFGESEYQKK